MRDMRKQDDVVVRRLDRGDLDGMGGAIPADWLPVREPDDAFEEPASLAGWSWGLVAPRAVTVSG